MPSGIMDRGRQSTGTLIGRPRPQISKPPRSGMSSMAGRVAGHIMSDEDAKKKKRKLDELRLQSRALGSKK